MNRLVLRWRQTPSQRGWSGSYLRTRPRTWRSARGPGSSPPRGSSIGGFDGRGAFQTGEGEKERTGGKQKPDFLSGLERPSRADAEKVSAHRRQELVSSAANGESIDGTSTRRGGKRRRKTKKKCVSAAPEHNFLRLCSSFCLSLCCPAVRRYPQRDAACRRVWGGGWRPGRL